MQRPLVVRIFERFGNLQPDLRRSLATLTSRAARTESEVWPAEPIAADDCDDAFASPAGSAWAIRPDNSESATDNRVSKSPRSVEDRSAQPFRTPSRFNLLISSSTLSSPSPLMSCIA